MKSCRFTALQALMISAVISHHIVHLNQGFVICLLKNLMQDYIHGNQMSPYRTAGGVPAQNKQYGQSFHRLSERH